MISMNDKSEAAPHRADPEAVDTAALPLSGVTVLDLTLARAGPTCVRHLADWGANVIRVDPPGGQSGAVEEDVVGNNFGPDYLNLHRNKRSVRIDLKHPDGLATLMALVRSADVLVENMRASVKHRLGIAWDDIRAVNPRIVYGSISGFGQDGPYAGRPGVDQVAQGMSGLMSITGKPGEGPMRVGIPVADLTAGNILALGLMIALFERERTGRGRWVQTSLLESQIFMLDFQAARWLTNHDLPVQVGNEHPTGIPTGVFATADGHINIAGSSTKMWNRLSQALGKPEWAERQEWQTQVGRVKDRAEVNRLIAEVVCTQPSAHWIERLSEVGVPCGPIYNVAEVFEDPQVRHLEIARTMQQPGRGEKGVLANPITIEGVSKDIRRPTPAPGEHTEEILREFGLSPARIQSLRESGAIGG